MTCPKCDRFTLFKEQLCSRCRVEAGMDPYTIEMAEIEHIVGKDVVDWHNGYIDIAWVAVPLGFGHIGIYVDAETEKVKVDTEHMGKDFALQVIAKAFENIEFDFE